MVLLADPVFVGVALKVGVAIGVLVGGLGLVGVGVAVAEGVAVGKLGLVAVGVGVLVAVLVGVKVAVRVGVNVGIAVDPPCVSMISWGEFAPDSRLAKLIALLLVVVRARLKTPLPVR